MPPGTTSTPTASTTPQTGTRITMAISSGTGFIINRAGDLVTNHHVLKQCLVITAAFEGNEQVLTLRAADPARDLAVLHMPISPPFAARLRAGTRNVLVGEPLVMLGYPGAAGIQGQSQWRTTKIIAMHGPRQERDIVQLAHVAEHGNSGGPLLDRSGNVVGIIRGNTEYYRTLYSASGQPIGEPKHIGTSDTMIHLNVLQEFLESNRIPFERSTNNWTYSDAQLHAHAQRFTLPIRCYQSITTQPLPQHAS